MNRRRAGGCWMGRNDCAPRLPMHAGHGRTLLRLRAGLALGQAHQRQEGGPRERWRRGLKISAREPVDTAASRTASSSRAADADAGLIGKTRHCSCSVSSSSHCSAGVPASSSRLPLSGVPSEDRRTVGGNGSAATSCSPDRSGDAAASAIRRVRSVLSMSARERRIRLKRKSTSRHGRLPKENHPFVDGLAGSQGNA